jgi:hypothetical protein
VRRGTTIALGAILVALFGAVILQLVVLGSGNGPGCTSGTVTAEGSSVYVLPKPHDGLARLDGRTVSGCAVVIQSVAGPGFWIGQETNRVFVVAAPSFTPRPGDKIDLTGTLRAVGDEQEAGLTDVEKQELRLDGDYVLASTVTPRG